MRPWIVVAALAMTDVAMSAAQSGRSDLAGIAWSSGRPLTWNDYRGTPELGTDASATTVYEIAYEEGCDDDAFSFTVVSRFRRDRSWVRPSLFETPARAARLLDHEQGHFDLSEVHARQLRQRMATLKNPCGMTRADRGALVTRQVREATSNQGRYDRETNFGRDTRAQARWSADTSRALKRTAAWAAR